MNCSVPGCPALADEDLVRVRARPATDFEPGMRAVALTYLCPTHHREFETLGWLAPVERDDEGDT